MGHIIGKDIYRELGNKVDGTTVRMPWNSALHNLLKELYTTQEADLICRMPYRPSTLSRVSSITNIPEQTLEPQLDVLCHKGLVCDIWENDQYLYMISPFVIGFFEFTMMRTGGNLPQKKWAELFQAYMFGSKDFLDANFADGQQLSVMRALPHEETVGHDSLGDHVEILDYEKASSLIEDNTRFAVSLCSCRHEKMHFGEQHCKIPLETCTSMGSAADFLIRNDFAREISKAEMQDIMSRSKEHGFTLSTDNVKQGAGFICHCCGCCCNLLQGIKETGYAGILVSSSFMATCITDTCNGCGLCAKACPIDAITIEETPPPHADITPKKSRRAVIDESICLGCGVCALRCKQSAIYLEKRKQRVLHPEDSFERVILQSLERDTLQNLLFDNPSSKTEGFMRGLVGGFLRLSPVKKALMSETLRSRFLNAIRKASA